MKNTITDPRFDRIVFRYLDSLDFKVVKFYVPLHKLVRFEVPLDAKEEKSFIVMDDVFVGEINRWGFFLYIETVSGLMAMFSTSKTKVEKYIRKYLLERQNIEFGSFRIYDRYDRPKHKYMQDLYETYGKK